VAGSRTTKSNTKMRLHSFLPIPKVIRAAVLSSALMIAAVHAARNCGPFAPVATYTVSGAVAEIITATPDGKTLIYTDSETQEIGFVDITNPANPTELGTLPVAGEPTSVAVAPDGKYAIVVVHGEPDHLAVIDLGDTSAEPVIHELGGQPDSIAISPNGRYAAIAIENERDEDVNEGALPQFPAGFVTIVDLVGSPANWTLRDVFLTGLADRFSADPEPEFIDINAANQAAVTLQENNHIVIIDLPTGSIDSHFSAGSVKHVADLQDDGRIKFSDLLRDSRREPDSIHWTPDGNLAIANEGDYDLDVEFVGGRSFTILTATGGLIFEAGADLEKQIARAGLYDDTRSDSKGTEPEGIEIGKYDGQNFVFVGLERAVPGAVAVYTLHQERRPLFRQILETGNRPEGLLALPQRNLFVTANEGDGTISIFALQ
jgi:DNA-binding beta-propeller fold protein YncE